ncbi:MAG: SLC13 family permease [Nitrososphaeria archaeon]
MRSTTTFLSSIHENKKMLLYLIFLIISPFIFYTIFSNILIPETPSYIYKGWTKYNEPEFIFKQTISIAIFGMVIFATLLFWKYRVPVAMAGTALLLLGGFVDISTLVEYMNIPVILFLLCMMVVVSYIRSLGFFDYFLERTMLATKFEPKLLLVFFVLMSAFMAAAVDEVSSILFMSVLIFDLAKRFDINPIPYLICAIFATNIGSSATVLGNPVGIYVAFYADLTFGDFLMWSTPAAVLSALIIIPILFKNFNIFLNEFRAKIVAKEITSGVPTLTGESKKGGILFLIMITLLALHSTLEVLLELPTNSLLIAIPLCLASYVLLSLKDEAASFFEKNVEWWTIVYFMFLFSISSTVEFTGVSAKLSILLIDLYKFLAEILPSPFQIIVIFILAVIIIGTLSSLVDNIVSVAVFLPIISEVVALNVPFGGILWWSTLIGGCYFGNATPIGSTANIVMLGLLDKRYNKSISFRSWISLGLKISLLTSLIASSYVLLLKIMWG